MLILLYIIHVIVCFFLILVVLLQQGKGADLAVFGGGSTQTAFGARGATTLLHKLTVASFVMFILTTVSIGIFVRGTRSGSVIEGVDQEAAQQVPVGATDDAPAAPAAPAAGDPADGDEASNAGDGGETP